VVRRKVKIAGIIISLITLYSGLAQPAWATEEGGISLAQAIRMALANPYNLGSYGAAVAEAEAKVDQATAARWPSFSLSTNYTRMRPTGELGAENKGGTGTYSTGVNLQLPLYMGEKLASGVELAEIDLKGEELNYQAKSKDLVYSVVQTYVNVLKADGMLALRQDQIKLLTEYQRLIEANLNLGYATQSDLMETKLRLTQAELDAVKAEHGKKKVQDKLCSLMGIPPQDLVLTSKPAFAVEHELPALESFLHRTQEGRPELKSLEIAVRSAEENLELSKGYWKPNLIMIGAYEAQNPDHPTLKDGVWRFTLNLDWKFFDAGAGKAGVKQAEATLEKLRFQLAQTKEEIQLEVRQKYLAVTEAAQVLALTKLGRSQAEANFQMQKTMFQLGVVTNMELLSAQNALNSALNDDLNAEYDYYLAVSALYHAIGETDQFLLEVGDNL
jgi:outer membrane protein